MTCAEFKELAPLAALGLATPSEADRLEGHLAGQPLHAGCQAAWAEAQAAAQLMADELPPVEPSPALWAGIEVALAEEADRAMSHASARAPRARFAGQLALAASVAAVALLIGRQVGQSSLEGNHRAELAQIEARVAAAQQNALLATTRSAAVDGELSGCRRDLGQARDQLQTQAAAIGMLDEVQTQLLVLGNPKHGAPPAARVKVIFNGQSHRAVVVASGLSPTANKDYELWVIRGKEKLPAGLFKLRTDGPSLLAVDERLLGGGVDLFAITLEPAGGGPVPRGDLVLAGAVKKKG